MVEWLMHVLFVNVEVRSCPDAEMDDGIYGVGTVATSNDICVYAEIRYGLESLI